MFSPSLAKSDRSGLASTRGATTASLVQAAQEHADHASVLLEQTKQFADDIRSQVASRELAGMNERLMAFGDSLLAAPGRHPCIILAGQNASPRAPLSQRLMIADLAPIDHDPHRLAVTVYHYEVEGRREGVILEGLRQRVRVVAIVSLTAPGTSASAGR